MCPVCLFHNVGFLEVVNKYRLTHDDYFLDFVDLILSHLPYNVRSGREVVNFHHDVLILEDMSTVVALCQRKKKPLTDGHLLFFR